MTDPADADLADVFPLSAGDDDDDRTVVIRDTTFTINKMLVMEGYQCLEILRSGLSAAIAASSAGEDLGSLVVSGLSGDIDLAAFGEDDTGDAIASGMKAVIEIIAGYPIKQWEMVRRHLFRHVTFSRPNIPTPRVLAGNEDAAFDGLDPAHVTVVAVRALIRNFRGSLPELLSLIPAAAAAQQGR